MSFSKKDIAKNISSNINISETESKLLLDSFINIIKSKSQTSSLKIASFGTFSIKRTPQRIGRNPKTKQEFSNIRNVKIEIFCFKQTKKFNKLIWSGWPDLNRRPLHPQCSALPGCATSRKKYFDNNYI